MKVGSTDLSVDPEGRQYQGKGNADIEVVREERKRLAERVLSDKATPWTPGEYRIALGHALAALDSLEAELAREKELRAKAEENWIALGNTRDGMWAHIKELEAELAQARVERDAAITEYDLARKRLDENEAELAEWRERCEEAESHQSHKNYIALQTELAQANHSADRYADLSGRYREALEQLKHLPDAYGGKIVRDALARGTEPEDKPTDWLPHGYHEVTDDD